MRYALFAILWFRLLPSCLAGFPPPLESELVRSETIFLGRLISKSDATHAVMQVNTVWRGRVEGSLTLECLENDPEIRVGAVYLLISQGDDHYGKPLPRMGRYELKGQSVWRGWLAYRLSGEGEHQFVEGAFSFAFSEINRKLSMGQLKSLIEQHPYNPHVYDKHSIKSPG